MANATSQRPTSHLAAEKILGQILDPKRRGALYPLYHKLRDTAPVFKTSHPALRSSWILTRHADAEHVLRKHVFNTPEADTPRIYNTPGGQVFYDTMRRMLHNLEFSEHQRIRKLISKAFTVRSTEKMRSEIAQQVDDLLDELAPQGWMDLIADFARPFPANVILRLMAVPRADRAMLAKWADDFIRRLDVGTSIDRHVEQAGNDAAEGLRGYFSRLLALRRSNPGDDLISALASVHTDGTALVSDEIVSTAIVLFEGGHQTTTNLFGTAFVSLFRHPQQLERLGLDTDLTKNACEELLRYDAPVQLVQRVVITDTEIGDVSIPAGEIVAVLVGAANRDPSTFTDPDVLWLDRPNAHSHLSFGNGHYHCIGAPLARLNFSIALPRLLDRLPGLAPAYEEPAWGQTLVNWGPSELPVRWNRG
jgi:cytochrome P450